MPSHCVFNTLYFAVIQQTQCEHALVMPQCHTCRPSQQDSAGCCLSKQTRCQLPSGCRTSCAICCLTWPNLWHTDICVECWSPVVGWYRGEVVSRSCSHDTHFHWCQSESNFWYFLWTWGWLWRTAPSQCPRSISSILPECCVAMTISWEEEKSTWYRKRVEPCSGNVALNTLYGTAVFINTFIFLLMQTSKKELSISGTNTVFSPTAESWSGVSLDHNVFIIKKDTVGSEVEAQMWLLSGWDETDRYLVPSAALMSPLCVFLSGRLAGVQGWRTRRRCHLTKGVFRK